MQRIFGSLLLSLLALSVVGAVSGCSKRYHDLPAFSAIPFRDYENQSVGRFKTTYLADQIHAYFRGNAAGPIAVATFVDIDNLYNSSTFGRVVAEQLMSELAMRGYSVIEVRQADALQIMPFEGEFALSHETKKLRKWQDLSGVVVGTYVDSPVRVYVNARLIDPATSMIVSAGSIEMAKTAEIARLIRRSQIPPSMERIPVRHLGYASHPLPYNWPWPYQLPRDEEALYPDDSDAKGTELPMPQGLPPLPKLQ